MIQFSNGIIVGLNPKNGLTAATAPFTWANGDRFIWNGSYEIA
jgi:hypothetical protein